MLGVQPRMAAGMPAAGYGSGAILASSGVAWPAAGGGPTGQRIVALAQAELGVREEPMGSNEGTRIRQYRTATKGAEHTPGPWCAYFVSWLAREAGAPIGPDGAGTGWVPSIESWGKSEGRFIEGGARPQPGDIIIFDWQGDGLSDHTGIVERVDRDGTVHTIEGNSSDMVRRRSYAQDASSIAGYVRP
jgi:uncharacterized protein (TIGR02594 family)